MKDTPHRPRRCRFLTTLTALILALLLCGTIPARAFDLKQLRNPTDEWLRSDEGRSTADHVVSWQNADGGWWKNYDYARPRRPDDGGDDSVSGFDNGATHTEMRFLARAYGATGEDQYRQAFERGLDFILRSQMPSGGWPQQVPAGSGYARHITFNDNAMTSVLRLLRDIADGRPEFGFVSQNLRNEARSAYERGIECILKCQIVIDGELTGWCAQHDAVTFTPAGARSYELPSLSGSEGADIVLLLMEIENPDPRVRRAIHAAVRWFERSKITGLRLERQTAPDAPGGTDLVLVPDPDAPALWARFYDLETNQPFYCDRDGVKRSSLADIGHERRNGYAWIRPFGQRVLDLYPAWVKQHGPAEVDPSAGANQGTPWPPQR